MLLPIIDLGEMKHAIVAPEIKAAAAVAHEAGFAFAKLTTPGGGVIHISAQARDESGPVRVFITGGITIVSLPSHPVQTVSQSPHPLPSSLRYQPNAPLRPHLCGLRTADTARP